MSDDSKRQARTSAKVFYFCLEFQATCVFTGSYERTLRLSSSSLLSMPSKTNRRGGHGGPPLQLPCEAKVFISAWNSKRGGLCTKSEMPQACPGEPHVYS